MTRTPSRVKGADQLRYQILLKSINKFIRAHQEITYPQFDYYVVHDLALFSISHNLKLETIEQQVQEIIKSLGVIMNIFNNPTIVLKDNSDVVNIENAKVINQNALLHLANHSHLLSTVNDSGVQPKKIMTRVYEDDYSLYENQIFCNLIDKIVNLVKKHRNYLNGLLFTERHIEFSFREHVNHPSYFLALGKLYTGYTRNHSQYFGMIHKLLDQTQLILQTISPLLSRPVYQKNLKRDKYLELRNTNIFHMQKDYRRIYKTYRYLQRNNEVAKKIDVKINEVELRRNYIRYVLILTIFAIGHFNFETDSNATINLKSLNTTFTFKNWSITIDNTNNREIIIRFTKDKSYNIMLVEHGYDDIKLMKIKRQYQINETILVSQVYEDYLTRNYAYISMEDIDSFRRLQQIILKGMIQVDESHRICPFCGEPTSYSSEKKQYFCRSCMSEIYKTTCPIKNIDYYYTDCQHLREQDKDSNLELHENDLSVQRQIESALFYRNITKIDNKARIICPHCQQVH